MNLRTIGEILAVIGVVLSLTFVGMELRQNTISSRAAAFQELGIATTEIWYEQLRNPELSEVIWQVRSEENYIRLTPAQQRMAITFAGASIRLFETIYLQVEQGLLDSDALESLGWGWYRRTPFFTVMWPHVREFVTPEFAAYLDSSLQTNN